MLKFFYRNNTLEIKEAVYIIVVYAHLLRVLAWPKTWKTWRFFLTGDNADLIRFRQSTTIGFFNYGSEKHVGEKAIELYYFENDEGQTVTVMVLFL